MNKKIISILSVLTGATIGASVASKLSVKTKKKIQSMSDKHLTLFVMMNQWVRVKQEGKNVSSYFINNGYKKIAIYGMSYAGETLIEELKNTEVEVLYGIDRNAKGVYTDIDVVSPDEDLKEVDAIVVTAVFFFDEIEKNLAKKFDFPIISLEDILYEI